MTPEMWFAFVILPIALMIAAMVIGKIHDRWLARLPAREHPAGVA